MIALPYSGQFDEYDLLDHITASGRDYIIQGQQAAARANYTKPHSFDYWLRRLGHNADTKQAENSVLAALVATGLFVIVDDLLCPGSGIRCKGIRVVTQLVRNKPQ